MVKLNSWNDINKSIFKRHLPEVISATELRVFRSMESVFSGKDKHGEIHQCGNCGNLFYLGEAIKDNVPKDWLGNPICPMCSKSPDFYQDKEWRRKFKAFHEITEAIMRFEESEPNQNIICLKEVKELSKEFFDFATISEMYIGYYKMMSDLGAGDSFKNLKPEWKALIDSLFESAKSNTAEFLKFIFSPDSFQIRQILSTIWEAKFAIARMEKDYFLSRITDYPIFLRPITVEDVEETKIRFSLLIYNHLTELDSMYDLTMNLIRLSQGETFVNNPFPRSNRYRYPTQKIKKINRENSQLGAIFNDFYVSQVRHAFSHSKYKIEKGLFVKTDENFSIPINELQAKFDLCSDYYNYLENWISKEEAFAYEKQTFHTSDGSTITISSDRIPDNL